MRSNSEQRSLIGRQIIEHNNQNGLNDNLSFHQQRESIFYSRGEDLKDLSPKDIARYISLFGERKEDSKYNFFPPINPLRNDQSSSQKKKKQIVSESSTRSERSSSFISYLGNDPSKRAETEEISENSSKHNEKINFRNRLAPLMDLDPQNYSNHPSRFKSKVSKSTEPRGCPPSLILNEGILPNFNARIINEENNITKQLANKNIVEQEAEYLDQAFDDLIEQKEENNFPLRQSTFHPFTPSPQKAKDEALKPKEKIKHRKKNFPFVIGQPKTPPKKQKHFKEQVPKFQQQKELKLNNKKKFLAKINKPIPIEPQVEPKENNFIKQPKPQKTQPPMKKKELQLTEQTPSPVLLELQELEHHFENQEKENEFLLKASQKYCMKNFQEQCMFRAISPKSSKLPASHPLFSNQVETSPLPTSANSKKNYERNFIFSGTGLKERKEIKALIQSLQGYQKIIKDKDDRSPTLSFS